MAITKKTVSSRTLFAIMFIICITYAGTLIFAFGWAIVSGCKNNNDFVLNPFSFPKIWYPQNFFNAFSKLKINIGGSVYVNLIGMIFNSIWITFGGTILSIGCATTLTYVISKYDFTGKKLLYAINLVVMTLPIMGSMPALYKFVTDIRIINTPLILIMYAGGFGFNFLVLYGYFKNLPWSYAESCFMDGASDFKAFFYVMLPMAMPAILSLCIISGIGVWNDYQTPMLYLNKYPNLALGLYKFNAMMVWQADYPTLFAGLIISTIPILIIFSFFSETIMTNVTAGGLKG